MNEYDRLDEILVDQNALKDFHDSFKKPPKKLPARFITLQGLLNVLAGKTFLFSTPVLTIDTSEAHFVSSLAAIFAKTQMDVLSGDKPLLIQEVGEKDNKRNKNKDRYTALRHSRFTFYDEYKTSSFKSGGEGVVAWRALKKAFCDGKAAALEGVLQNLKRLLSPIHNEALVGIHQVYCYVNGLDDLQQPMSTDICCRQIAILFVESLLDERVFTAECGQWVETGIFPQAAPKNPSADVRDPLEKYFGTGIFVLKRGEIQPQLLPDIKTLVDDRETVYQYNSLPSGGTPLEQVLEANPDQTLFLLCGDQDSGISGAGKTTSLRKLYYDQEASLPIFVPLSQVYSTRSLRSIPNENGRLRLLTWLAFQGRKYADLEALKGRLVLMDGLDEITDQTGLQLLCDDLLALHEQRTIRVVISSKLPPEKLAAWDSLKNIGSLWNQCLSCFVQPMRGEQKERYVGTQNSAVYSMLTTPFLLQMYQNVKNFLSQDSQSSARALYYQWISEDMDKGKSKPPDAGGLFYRYLVVQLCRWFDANKGMDAQNEADAFFLMYALSAIAFHMELNEVYDPEYTPVVRKVDENTMKQLLEQSFPAFRAVLKHYRAYQNKSKRSTLAASIDLLNQKGFAAGQASTILHNECNDDTLEYEHRFVNRAIQENLAALHLANLFFAARHNTLSQEDTLLSFYTCPAYFLPQFTLEKAVNCLDELFGKKNQTRELLISGPGKLRPDQDFSRYLLYSLASAMCAALKLEQKTDWQSAAEQAYLALLRSAPNAARQYCLDHILNLCAQAQYLRQSGTPKEAIAKARTAIAFCTEHQVHSNSDGYHALAKVYLEQIGHILNQDDSDSEDEQLTLDIPEDEIAFSHRVYDELKKLTQGGALPEYSPFFGKLPSENQALAAPLLQILEKARLRLEQYEIKEFFHSSVVKFLLTASYAAKAHSVYAAFSQGASGAAMNMLACFLENNQEELEHHRALPFFQKHPAFHLDIPPSQLEYANPSLSAFLVYLRIYNIKRGTQPYSARKLAQALLNRRVRLDERGIPIPGPGEHPALSAKEQTFLSEATERACTGSGAGYAIPRIRFLHECMQTMETSENSGQTAPLLAEARTRFQKEWELCRCEKKLIPNGKKAPDFNTAMLVAEYSAGYLTEHNLTDWKTSLLLFFEQALQDGKEVTYTTGTRLQKQDYLECWQRLCRLSQQHPDFQIHPDHGANARWQKIAQALLR